VGCRGYDVSNLGGVPSINSVEIKEAVYKLLEVAFDAAEFPFTTAERALSH
jgi:hypothetical protein